jgi:Polyketide cyclase / dehydrase and lipid transport
LPLWEHRIVVDRPIDEMRAQVIDTFNAPRLVRREGVLSMRETSSGPRGLGSTYSERRLILGFETRLNARITEWDPPHTLATTIEGRPFRSLVSRFTLTTVADGTEVHTRDEFELKPVFKLLWPIIGPLLTRRREKSMRDFKMMLEAES